MQCPRCHVRLNRVTTRRGMFFHCTTCRGRAAGFAVLRQVGAKERVRNLWTLARDCDAQVGVACPVCQRPTAEVALPVQGSATRLHLDVCTGCQFVWFDAQEFEQFPASPQESDPAPLSEKAREAIAINELRRASSKVEPNDGLPPSDPWDFIPAFLGMPVEERAPMVRCWPWLTYGLAAVLVAVFAFTVPHLDSVVQEFGMVPRLWPRYDGLTLATSFFLHAGLWHLIGNVYFLMIFGDNVEDDLGWWRCALLIAAAHLVGIAWHILSDPASMTPCVGASAGISGVIVYYALRFPQARLGYLVGVWARYRYVRFPAYVALIFWLLLQFLFVVEHQAGVSNVAALAHLGGAMVGVVAWFFRQIGGLTGQTAV